MLMQYYARQHLYLSPDTCLLRSLTQSFTRGEWMERKIMSSIFQPTALVGAIMTIFAINNTANAATGNTSAIDTSLNTIVVTASLYDQNIDQVPARISVINEAVINQSPIATLPDLLKREAAANVVQSGGYGQQSSIFLRGSNSTQTLLLRDGVRLNGASSGAAPLAFLDTTDIERIEVLKGPASVLYGTDAIGGVIQLISKKPEKNQAFVTGEYGENNTYKAIVGADLFDDGWYAQIRGQSLETDGTPVKDALGAEDASFQQKGASAKFGVEKENYTTSVDYSQNQGTSEYDNYGALASQDFKNEIINLKGSLKLNDDIEIKARLSQFNEDLDQNQSADFIHNQTKQAELHTKWQFSHSQNLILGVEHQKTEGDILSYGTPYNESVASTGYFIQHQYNANGLNSQVGIRVEDNQKYGTNTVAQAGLRYQLLPLTSVYTNIGTAFRAPNLNELYGWGGNPNLDPEKSTSYEIGLDQKLNHGFSTGLSLYQTNVKDLIDSTDKTGYAFQNIDKADFEGAELYLKWQQNALYSHLSYNYIDAKNKTTDEKLSRRPKHKASWTTGWETQQYGASATLTAVSHADNSAYDDIRLPGYLTADLHAYYQIQPFARVFTNIQNIGDVNYKAAYGSGSYFIDGGRLASLGVTFKY